MQTSKDHHIAQQEIMAAKNMYSGKIDGIWGPKTIAAKQKWERSGKFAPGIPNNGFPLDDRAPLPAGVIRKPDGTLTCVEIAAKTAPATPQTTPQPAAIQPVPVVEAPVAEAEAAPVGNPNQNPNRGNNQNNQQNGQRHGGNQNK